MPKRLAPVPAARWAAAKRLRSVGSGMMTLPVSAPARLKVLVAAVSMTSRSAMSGAASGIGTWRSPAEHEVVVDLVGDQQQVVGGGEVGERPELVAAPDPAAGVVRRAEHDHALGAGQRRGERLEVHGVAAVGRRTSGDSRMGRPLARSTRKKAW